LLQDRNVFSLNSYDIRSSRAENPSLEDNRKIIAAKLSIGAHTSPYSMVNINPHPYDIDAMQCAVCKPSFAADRRNTLPLIWFALS
jgi:hypothetical protein